MAQKLIRDIPDETMSAIEAKAGADGMNAEAWIRAQLIRLAQQPTIRKRYKFTALGENGAKITIERHHADGPVQRGARNCSQEQFDAFQRAALYAERNEMGDYEAAYKLLLQNFVEVFV